MAWFVQYDDDDLVDFCWKRNAKNTDRATNFGIKLLGMFFTESGCDGNIDTPSPEDLNSLLVHLYAGVHTAKGEIQWYQCISASNYISGIDILNNNIFQTANLCFENVLKQIKRLASSQPTIIQKTGKNCMAHLI